MSDKSKPKKAQSDSSKEDKKQSTGFENQEDFLKPQALDALLDSVKALLQKFRVTAEEFLQKASAEFAT